MKTKHLYILTATLCMLLFGGCTLSTEEWIIPEEEKGYEEPVVIENEFMKLSYKFKPTTRNLTDSIMQYVAIIENDTVIYFMNSLPKQWLPQVGGCVACSCCDDYPTGLLARVLSVEKVDGMYKVTTTYAELEDVFDEYDFDFDSQLYFTNIDLNDEEQTRAAALKHRPNPRIRRIGKHIDEDEHMSVDWTMYDMAASGNYPRRKTRTTDFIEPQQDRSGTIRRGSILDKFASYTQPKKKDDWNPQEELGDIEQTPPSENVCIPDLDAVLGEHGSGSSGDWDPKDVAAEKEKEKDWISELREIFQKDVYDEDEDETKELPYFTLSNSDPWWNALKDKLKTSSVILNTWSAEVCGVERVHYIKKIKLSERYDYTENEVENGFRIKGTFGHNFISSNDPKKWSPLERLAHRKFLTREVQEGLRDEKNSFKDKLEKINGHNIGFYIPLKGGFLGIILLAKPNIDVSLSIVGKGDLTLWYSHTMNVEEVRDGVKLQDYSVPMDPRGFRLTSPAIVASFEAQMGADIILGLGHKEIDEELIGLEFKPRIVRDGKFDGIGFYVNPRMYFNAEWGLRNWGEMRSACYSDGYKLGGEVEFGVIVFTGHWGDFKFFKHYWPSKEAQEKGSGVLLSGCWYPRITDTKSQIRTEINSKGQEVHILDAQYTLKSLGFGPVGVCKDDYSMGLLVYREEPAGKTHTHLATLRPLKDGEAGSLGEDVKYSFRYQVPNGQDTYVIRPIIVDEKVSENSIVYPSTTVEYNKTPFFGLVVTPNSAGRPVIAYIKNVIPFAGTMGTLDEYNITMPFYVGNAPNLKKSIYDFYFKVTVDEEREFIVPAMDFVTSSGNYHSTLSFNHPNNQIPMIHVTPVMKIWVDNKIKEVYPMEEDKYGCQQYMDKDYSMCRVGYIDIENPKDFYGSKFHANKVYPWWNEFVKW